MSGEFKGFPDETFTFLKGLADNNNRGWFEANRQQYEDHWKAPAFALIDALAEPMAALSPALKAEARINGTLRRINRDVRFSNDKSPYNPRMHLIFWSGSHPNRSPAFHLVLQADSVGFGSGVFGLGAEKLRYHRDRIMQTKERAGLLSAIKKAENFGCGFEQPELKRLPAGYSSSQAWSHLLRRKSFVLKTADRLPVPDWIYNADCEAEILKILRGTLPFIRWLTA